MKAIVGAVLIDGAGGPPVSDSVVVVAGGQIQEAGARTSVPIPVEADKIDGSGKFLVPPIVDICDRADPPGLVRAANPDEARAQVAELAANHAGAIHLPAGPPAVVEAAVEAARGAGIPVTGHISTQAGAKLMVDAGARSLVGMIQDTEDLDPALLARLRDLRIVVAPALGKAGAALEIAKRNTRRMFQGGVPLAIATEGGDPVHEAELLVDAGVPPLDVIVAGAQRNTIEPGKPAGLLVLSANPGDSIGNLRRVTMRMSGGEWVR